MFNRKQAAPGRRPHPDPRTEAALQQVLALRRAAERAEERAAQLWEEERDQRDSACKSPEEDFIALCMEQARDAKAAAQEAEERVQVLHDEIGKRIALLPDDALLWLDGEVR